MDRYLNRLVRLAVFGPTQFAFPPELDPFSSELVSRKSEDAHEGPELDAEYGPEPAWDPHTPNEGASDEWSETDGSVISDAVGDGGGDGGDGGGDGVGDGDGCP